MFGIVSKAQQVQVLDEFMIMTYDSLHLIIMSAWLVAHIKTKPYTLFTQTFLHGNSRLSAKFVL